MRIAFSPCPNDTFLFRAWVEGLIGGPQVAYTLADIQKLNELAKTGTYDLIKVSCATLPTLPKDYQLLPIGAAVGYGCGPLLIANTPFSLNELPTKRIAIPGRDTTAHLLLNKIAPSPALKIFCRYDQVEDLLERGEVDAGVIIHETRFTHNRIEIADLGKLWEERFALPIPLGCLVAKKKLASGLTETLRRSLAHAHKKPPFPFMKTHAQEMAEEVIQQHVDLYVTEETANLSPAGYKAITHLNS